MKCPFCQNDMGDAPDACPHCQRRHAPQVAQYIAQGWNALQSGAEGEARAAFTQAVQATPPNDKKQVGLNVAHLLKQAKAPPATTPAAPSSTQPQAPPQAATVAAPAPRPQARRPAAGAAQRGVLFDFNEKPVNIVRVMDDAKRQQAEYAEARTRRMRLVALLIPAGLPFICADVALGYNICTFSLVTMVLWGAAIAGFILLRRNQPTGQEFGPGFDAARAIFELSRTTCHPSAPSLAGWT